MSNDYTQFYAELTLNSKAEADWAAEELSKLEKTEDGIGFSYDISEHKTKFGQPLSWDVSFEDNGGGENLEQLSSFIKSYLAKFDPKRKWGMEWAYIGDKPINGAFGGGAFVASATGVEWVNTNLWVQEKTGVTT